MSRYMIRAIFLLLMPISSWATDEIQCNAFERVVCDEQFMNDCWCESLDSKSKQDEEIKLYLVTDSERWQLEEEQRRQQEEENSLSTSSSAHDSNSGRTIGDRPYTDCQFDMSGECDQSSVDTRNSDRNTASNSDANGNNYGTIQSGPGTNDSVFDPLDPQNPPNNNGGREPTDNSTADNSTDDSYGGDTALPEDMEEDSLHCSYDTKDRMEDLAELVQTCQDKRDNTATYCELGGNEGLNNALSTLQQAARALTVTGAFNPQMACSDFGSISRTALGAMSGYRAICAPVKKVCEDACDEAVQEYQALLKVMKERQEKVAEIYPDLPQKEANQRDECLSEFKAKFYDQHDPKKVARSEELKKKSIFYSRSQCQGYLKDLVLGAVDAGAIYASLQSADKCEQQVADAQQGFCQLYPSSPVCATTGASNDCSVNPSSAMCVCQTNPQDPICLGLAGAATAPPAASSTSYGSTISGIGGRGASGDVATGSPGSTSSDVNQILGSNAGGASFGLAGGTAGNPGGGGSSVRTPPTGTSANLGSSGGGGAPPRARGRARRPKSNLPVASGSGFQRSRGTYGFKPGNFAKGQRGAASAVPSDQNPRNEAIDLRKYMPGGELDPRRGLQKRVAGYVKRDGITGATGPSLFDKVTRRYNVIQGELYQDAPKYRYKVRPSLRRN